MLPPTLSFLLLFLSFSSGMSASLVRKLTREEDAPPAVKTTVVAGGPVVDGTPAAEAVAEALLADDPVADTAVVDKAVAEEPVEDTPVADAPVADAPVDTPVMAEEENEALITEEIIKELSAQEEDSGWGLASIRENLQAANGYFDSLVELMGGRNGVCQYKCKYGKTPVHRYGYVTPEPNGCSSNLLGFQFDIGIPAMTQCCNQLDSCYNTCGSNKYLCDSKYRWCLHAICSDLKKSLGFVSKVKACETVADGLYNTVWTLGCRSFMNSQREACYCDGEERDEL